MTTIKTNSQYNFDQAENDIFSWKKWDGTNGDTLFHKPSGRSIYQMQWLNKQGKCESKVTGTEREQAIAFWNELKSLQDERNRRHMPYTGAEVTRLEELDALTNEPKHGQNGYCRKCHSYCDGDCEANG